jgi:hypothetical protein
MIAEDATFPRRRRNVKQKDIADSDFARALASENPQKT